MKNRAKIINVLHGNRTFNRAVFFGDSVTYGTGASVITVSWANLVQFALEYDDMINAGIGGSVLQNTNQTAGGPLSNNGRDTYDTRVNFYRPNYVYIVYGLNDIRFNDANFTAANYQNDLGEVVGGIIANGTPASNIIIGSPPYMNTSYYASYSPYNGGSTLKHTQYVAAAAAVASAYSTKYLDIYQLMLDNGGNSLISVDGIHPNDAGHVLIAQAMLALSGATLLKLSPSADTWIRSTSAISNFSTDSGWWVGDLISGVDITRSLVKFDLSGVPSGNTIRARLNLYCRVKSTSNDRLLRVYRTKRAWVDNQVTWNIYSTGNSWAGAGGFNTADCEQEDIGSRLFSASEPTDSYLIIDLSPRTKAGLDLGNGWLVKADTEIDDAYNFASSENTTVEKRPILFVAYR